MALSGKGIDVSEHQGKIDWKKVKQNGIDFCIIREGYRNSIDKYFLTNVNNAKEANVLIHGVYHFCYSINEKEVLNEAKSCIANIEKTKLGKNIFIFFDFEYDTVEQAKKRGVTLGKKECINFTNTFCDYVVSQGYKTGVYSNLDYYSRMYDKATIEKRPFWLAEYTNKAPSIGCMYHQYSSTGKINGINGAVDMDYYYTPDTQEQLTDGSEIKNPTVIDNSIKSNIDFSKYTGKISNSGSDERGKASGGKAGDQTGNEWTIRAWYNRPWDCVLRYPDTKVGQKIAELGIKAANNNLIGYNQSNRYSYWEHLKASNYDPSQITIACDADCSAGVIANTKAVGYLFGIKALQNINATYTGNMKNAFKNAGFQVLTNSKYLTSYNYLLPGDILLNEIHHTATNLGIGKFVNNSSSGSGSSSKVGKNITSTSTAEIQTMLNKVGNYGLVVDNDYGPATTAAVINFQQNNNLVADGIVGSNTLNKLKAAYSSSATPTTTAGGYNKTIKRNGTVTADALYVRTGPGTTYSTLKSVPVIYKNQVVGICDETKASNGNKWYYIKVDNVYGFCSANYIK